MLTTTRCVWHTWQAQLKAEAEAKAAAGGTAGEQKDGAADAV